MHLLSDIMFALHRRSHTYDTPNSAVGIDGVEAAKTLLRNEGAIETHRSRRWLQAALSRLIQQPWPFKGCKTLCMLGKGGSAKSTTAVQCAVIARRQGLRVLVLDCDRQRSVTGWSRIRKNGPRITVRECPYNSVEPMCRSATTEGFDLVIIDHPQQPAEGWPAIVRVTDLFILLSRPSIFDLTTAQAWLQKLRSHNAPHYVVISGALARRQLISHAGVSDAQKALEAHTNRIWLGQISNRQAVTLATAKGLGVIEYEPLGTAAAEHIVLWHRIRRRLQQEARK